MSALHLNTPGVLYSAAQNLTEGQKTQARTNIGAGAGASAAAFVSTSVAYAATVTPAITAGVARTELRIGALTGALLLANPTGTPSDGMVLVVSWSQDATGGRAVSYGNGYVGSDQVVLASITTAASKKIELAFRYNAADSLWVASALNTR